MRNFVVMEIDIDRHKSSFINLKHNIIDSCVKYKNAQKIVNEINIPEINEAIYLILTGNFIFGDFIIQFISEKELEIEELTIITLSIGYENIEALSELLNQKWVEKINFIVSGYFIRTEKIKHTRSIMLLNEATKNDNFKVFTINTHQKLALLKLKNGSKLVFHGSANMKGSQNLEQLMIDNNHKLYDFNYNYFQNLIQKQNGKIR